MLYVFGVGEVPISISGDPLEPSPLIHTTRAVGTVDARDGEAQAKATRSACADPSAPTGRSPKPSGAMW